MFYPEEFKSRVKKACFSLDKQLQEEVQQLLTDGDPYLATLLSHGFTTTFSFQEILDANSLEELQIKAKKIQEFYLLSLECRKLFKEQLPF